MRSRIALLLTAMLFAATAVAQQPNSPQAGLTMNGSSGNVALPVRSILNLTVSGGPFKRFFLVYGQPLGFSVPTPAGLLEIDPPAPFGGGTVFFDGFADPYYNTGAGGSFNFPLELPAILPPGITIPIQGVVEDPGSPIGLTLTALCVGTTTFSQTGGPQFLFFIPILGAQGTLPVLPEAGTMPGDMPEMDPIGEIGFTNVYDPTFGLPVYTPFAGPFVCASCHNVPNVYQSYMGTMMANATRDPIFKGAFAVACDDLEYLKAQAVVPFGKEAVADFCIRCHSPAAWQGGRSGVKGDGVTSPYEMDIFDETLSLDQEGVVCEVCHRATDYTPTIAPGFSYDATRPENGQLVFTQTTTRLGPFPGTLQTTYFGTTAYGALLPGYNENLATPIPDIPPGSGSSVSPAHGTEQGAFMTSSRLCGSCHNVTNPITGSAEQRTFTEWEKSSYGDPMSPDFATCQDCHMKETPGMSQACNLLGLDLTYGQFAKQRQNLPRHRFAGANVWVPQLFKILYPNVDAPWTNGNLNFTGGSFNVPASRDTQWDDATAEAQLNLGQSAQVDMTATESTPNVITATVTIENKTGHKLPSGYPEGRHMWIRLIAEDANGTPFFQTGLLDTNGELVQDPNLKVYEMKQGMDYPQLGLNQQESFHLVLNNMTLKDNRLHPKGFTQQKGLGGTDSYDPVLAPWPVGGLYPDNHYIDNTVYTIAIPPNTPRPIKVKATVFHQVSSFAYVDFLANGGDATNQTMPNPIMQTVRNLWTMGTSRAPATSVGYLGPTTPTDPSSPYATALRVIP